MTEAQVEVSPRTRALTLAGVAALHLAAIAALIAAFGVEVVTSTVRGISAFDVPLPPSPPPTPTPTAKAAERPSAENAPAPKATARPARVRPPVIVRPSPAPSPSASVPAAAGRANAGPGTGDAGAGTAAGAGGRGDGAGGGFSRRAQKIGGDLDTKDFPKSGAGERDGRFIIVRYDVGADGRVDNCRVVESSGSREADAITCRLIEKRFRYRPALDARGNPRPDQTGWKQWWWRPG